MAGFWDTMLGGMNATAPTAGFEHWADTGPKIDQGFQIAETRGAPQLNAGPQDQFRGMQMTQAGQLAGIASGQRQGAGELAAQRQVANAMAQQQAMARMARGGNALLAGRQAARNTAGIGLAGAGMGQQAALGDQAAAHGLLAQLTGQGRGQDLQLAGQNAQLQQNQMGMNDQLYMGMLQQLTGMDAAQLQAKMAAYQAQAQQQGLLGPLIGAGGQIGAAAAMSDERVKTDISDAGSDIDEMLDALRPKNYRYKDPKHGIGPRAGIMAQDLERSRAGSRIVREVADGKALDINAALSASLASAARLNERLRKLERKAG